jgi:hypothetical protein
MKHADWTDGNIEVKYIVFVYVIVVLLVPTRSFRLLNFHTFHKPVLYVLHFKEQEYTLSLKFVPVQVRGNNH